MDNNSERKRDRRLFSGDESGAALLEFTLVATLLFMILFGIVEFGLAFRDRLTIANSTQTSARVVSALGSDEHSDFETLKSLEQTLNTLPNSGVGVIRFVDIYLVDSSGGIAGACVSGGGSLCNRYLWTPDPAGCDWTPCPDPDQPGGYSGWTWDPAVRDVGLPDLDVVGVRVTFAHTWMTGGLVPLPNVDCTGPGFSNCWADTAILRFEPQVFE
jgi:hypothetical protein